MDYCISDIHGNYDLFCRLMEKIRFSGGDRLYVMGDIVEKGPDSIRLAKLLFSLGNVFCIVGSHEHAFLKYYHNMMRETQDYESVLARLQAYFSDGYLLDWDIVDAFDLMPYYIETQNFIGVHAGLPVSANKVADPDSVKPELLVYDRTFKDPDVLPTNSKCVFFGHTPTWYVTGGTNEVLFYPRAPQLAHSRDIRDYCKVHLDTDTYRTGVLACVCADTCECFYVKKGF